jgi:endoglycosylceramidase
MFLVRTNGKFLGTGIFHVPGGNAYRNRSVLSYHYYCTILAIKPVPGNAEIPFFDKVLCNWIEEPAVFRSVQVN